MCSRNDWGSPPERHTGVPDRDDRPNRAGHSPRIKLQASLCQHRHFHTMDKQQYLLFEFICFLALLRGAAFSILSCLLLFQIGSFGRYKTKKKQKHALSLRQHSLLCPQGHLTVSTNTTWQFTRIMYITGVIKSGPMGTWVRAWKRRTDRIVWLVRERVKRRMFWTWVIGRMISLLEEPQWVWILWDLKRKKNALSSLDICSLSNIQWVPCHS